MITEQHTQELLSRAYVTLVAGRAGVNLAVRELDYGIDGTFRPVKIVRHKRVEEGFAIDFQLKATINCELQEEHVVYDCEAATYNSLAARARDAGIPCLLLVLCLPTDRTTWLLIDEEKLTLQRCCYWFWIKGPLTDNEYRKRVLIPRTQIFTAEALTDMLDRLRAGEEL